MTAIFFADTNSLDAISKPQAQGIQRTVGPYVDDDESFDFEPKSVALWMTIKLVYLSDIALQWAGFLLNTNNHNQW